MNKLKNMKIKPVFFIVAIVTITLIIGLTYAYIYSQSTFENKFKASAYDIELYEEFNNDWGTKKVNISNKDTSPVVLRVNYNELWQEKGLGGGSILADNQMSSQLNQNNSCRATIYDDNNTTFSLSNIINGEEVVTKNWTLEWNNFIKGNDGWYYYTKVLDSNSSIQILESINIREDLISLSTCYEDYKKSEYTLSFNYEAIQADTNAIKDIWGYVVNIKDGDILWDF